MNTPLHDLLGPLYVINLDDRQDRWAECQEELRALGTDPAQLQRFSAYRSALHGSVGCALSHANVLMRFLSESDAPHCLVLEDDFRFVRSLDEVTADVRAFLASPRAWDVLLLSGNAVLSVVTENPAFHRVVTSQTASAYVVTRAAALKLIPKFLLGAERLRELLPALARQHWPLMIHNYAADMIWKDLQREGGWYVLSRRTIVQRPSFSDIEQKQVDYGV